MDLPEITQMFVSEINHVTGQVWRGKKMGLLLKKNRRILVIFTDVERKLQIIQTCVVTALRTSFCGTDLAQS